MNHVEHNAFARVIKHYTSHIIFIIADDHAENELQLLLLRNLGSVILWAIAVVLEDAST